VLLLEQASNGLEATLDDNFPKPMNVTWWLGHGQRGLKSTPVLVYGCGQSGASLAPYGASTAISHLRKRGF
jgi:hypothetical protein